MFNVSPIVTTLDASDLGFKPGNWPSSTMQFDVVFFRGPSLYSDSGDVSAVIYRAYAGDVLTVANDLRIS